VERLASCQQPVRDFLAPIALHGLEDDHFDVPDFLLDFIGMDTRNRFPARSAMNLPPRKRRWPSTPTMPKRTWPWVAYNWKGDFERAWPEYDLALSMAPNNADLLVIYATSGAARGKADLGLEFAQRALRLNPNYPAWYNRLLILIYYFGGEFENALTAARQSQSPGLQEYVLLAASCGQLNRTTEAAKAAETVRNLDPQFFRRGPALDASRP
jgi:tetratricopeptide (TPR) repeat protein